MTGMQGRPQFATNDSTAAVTVAEAIREMVEFEKDRPDLQLSIASAFFNVAGWSLISDVLRHPDKVRILLGAEPQRDTDPVVLRSETVPARRADRDNLEAALAEQLEELALERNLVPFTPEARGQVRALIDWLRTQDQAVEVRRYKKEFLHGKAYMIDAPLLGVIAGSSNFTYAGLSRNRELNLGQYEQPVIQQVHQWFDELWEEAEPFDLAGFYEEQVTPVAPWLVFLRMLWEAYGQELQQDEEQEANDPSIKNLLDFQRDGVARARRILEQYHGVLIADEVGLGKTFLGGALVKDTVADRKRVLIVAPKVIRDSVWKPYVDLEHLGGWVDVISYDDLLRDTPLMGLPSGRDPNEYSLVVLDEAHTVRNTDTQRANRLGAILKGTPRKQVVLLTATPVNNRLGDLHSLLSYFITHDDEFARIGIPSLASHFAEVEKIDAEELSPEHLFDILDAVAVRRTRRFIRNHYINQQVQPGGLRVVFPEPKVEKVSYSLDTVLGGFFTDFAHALGADQNDDDQPDVFFSGQVPEGGLAALDPTRLTLAGYTPLRYQVTLEDDRRMRAAEVTVAGLLRSGLLKRFESSAAAFTSTCRTMANTLTGLAALIEDQKLVARSDALREWMRIDLDDIASLDEWRSTAEVMDAEQFRTSDLLADIKSDIALLESMADRVETAVTPENDPKLKELANTLLQILRVAEDEAQTRQLTRPNLAPDQREIRDRDDRKVLVFSYFADTVHYLQDNIDRVLSRPELVAYQGRVAVVTGSRTKVERNAALAVSQEDAVTGFAPRTGGTLRPDGTPLSEDRFDLLITTDVLSEGVNLQQAHNVINYDLPWNPMRLVQRHGRVDRIGSDHNYVYLWCFFPDNELDALLGLADILHRKLMKAKQSIGAPAVLPGIDASDEQVFNATRAQIQDLAAGDAAIFLGASGSLMSGEEFRAMLRRAIEDQSLHRMLEQMPWGVGSGFAIQGRQPGIVFCARILDQRGEPVFRWVPRTPKSEEGSTVDLVSDSLTALTAANPDRPQTEALLPEDWQHFAYTAWAMARQDIVDAWNLALDNPASAYVPPAIRQAVQHLHQHNAHLPVDVADRAVSIYSRGQSSRVNSRVRALMRDQNLTDVQKSSRLLDIIDEEGLALPEKKADRFPIRIEDVHLIAWMAVQTPNQRTTP